MNNSIIAFLGKGGTGKTILSALAGKIAIEKGKRVLFIDADPAMGLTTVLNIDNVKTIGKAREEIILSAKKAKGSSDVDDLDEIIDYLIFESLLEMPRFSLISMGQTNTLGCFCPVNNLLRGTIKSIVSGYDIVIIDAEAGIEQINRQVTETVQYPIIITDNSLRGVKTAILINETISNSPAMSPTKAGLIFNRVQEAAPALLEVADKAGLIYYGSLPCDNNITEIDKSGLSPFEIDPSSKILKPFKEILENNILNLQNKAK